MSTMKIKAGLPEVIVRSWGNEPVILVAHALDSKRDRVFVGQIDAKRPISLPTDDVFDYDEQRFAGLLTAHSAGNEPELLRLYEDLRRQNKSSEETCNKYQYMLKSQNDEKPKVANTRSVAERGQQ
jgi:hypothetical protein